MSFFLEHALIFEFILLIGFLTRAAGSAASVSVSFPVSVCFLKCWYCVCRPANRRSRLCSLFLPSLPVPPCSKLPVA